MSEKIKDYANLIWAILFLFGFFFFSILKKDADISFTERRSLQKMPKLSIEKVFVKKGQASFMDDFEKYVADQFPMRETFREMHALTSFYVLNKTEVNDIYYQDGGIFKASANINEDSVEWSLDRMKYICDKYLEDAQVYFAMIPDKADYLNDVSLALRMDYVQFRKHFYEEMKDACQIIDLSKELSLDDYYLTDTHWKQERLVPIADKLLEMMHADRSLLTDDGKNKDGVSLSHNIYMNDFKGVYYGQGAIPARKDTLIYLTGGYLDQLEVACLDSGKEERMSLYNLDAAKLVDAYELFLFGSKAYITITNPNCKTDKELVVFRDSFGSSIAPLLAAGYHKLTLIDIRYISPSLLDRFLDFSNKDVLFLYSEQVLNSSKGQFLN